MKVRNLSEDNIRGTNRTRISFMEIDFGAWVEYEKQHTQLFGAGEAWFQLEIDSEIDLHQ